MRTFAQRQSRPQKLVSTFSSRSEIQTPPPHRHTADHVLVGTRNKGISRSFPTGAGELEVSSTDSASPRFGNDFSQIPALPMTAGAAPAKLAISEPDDNYEQEADRIADRLTASRGNPAVGALAHIQRVSRQPEDQMDAAPPSVQSVLASPGKPLEPAVRQEMEQRFGHDFSRVRVHSGPAAGQSAQDVDALAYTVGQHIVFAAGQLAPGTQQGRRLIAHELAHVVQQHASQAFVQRQRARVRSPHPDPFDDVMDQLEIVREGQLPLEFYRRPEIRKLSHSERVDMEFQRKLVAIGKLGELKWETAVPTLIQVLEDKMHLMQDFDAGQKLLLQQEAAASLAKIGGPKALAKLNDLLNSKDPKERSMASRGYAGGVGGQAVTDLIAALKKEKDTQIKSQIILALGNIGGSSASSSQEKELIAKKLIHEMENSSGEISLNAVIALGKVKPKSATTALLNQLRLFHSVTRFAQEVITALGEIRDDQAVDLIVIMLEQHGSEAVRSEAATALGKIGGSKARDALQRRLNKETNDRVKAAISKAIRTPPAIIHWEFR